MKYAIIVRRLAEAEVELAKAWYNLQEIGLGDEFVDQFEADALVISENPLRWPVYHLSIRRYIMHRFPYVMYYEVRGENVRILRVVHASRDPGPIKKLLG